MTSAVLSILGRHVTPTKLDAQIFFYFSFLCIWLRGIKSAQHSAPYVWVSPTEIVSVTRAVLSRGAMDGSEKKMAARDRNVSRGDWSPLAPRGKKAR